MNDRTTLEIIAPTVEEALAQGLAQLGLTADAVSVEVLDSGSKGLFGFGGRQVRVRLIVNPPSAPASQPEPPQAAAPAVKEVKPQVQVEAKPRRPEKKTEKNSDPQKTLPLPSAREEPVSMDPALDAAEAIVSKLIHLLGMKAQVSAHEDESS
ncbi:MAG: Jag N-terminal domain-containing protein, partial [Chloroflexi bacterium]|nr:Jag N-terminal domain-containing protein [Chloroflexota bacterium]